MASLNIYEFADSGAPLEAEVPSTWRGRAALADSDAQTDEISYAESDTQTKRPVEISTQTEPLDDGVGEAKRGEASLDFDGWTPAPDVADFLGRVAPIMNAHLERNAVSHAFDDFDVAALDEDESSGVLHDLSTTFMQPAEAVEAEDRGTAKDGEDVEMRLPCTGVSWSSTGSVVCASFGRLDHSGWCTHRAGVATWNVFKKDMNPEKPENVLETMSCVMCVACHPEMPSVVAAGTFNGEVAVWDTNLPEPHVAQSRIDDYFHREPVSRVEWVYDMFARTYMIASVSADGKVLFWTLKNKLAYPIQGFRLAPQSRRRGRDSSGDAPIVGGTALAFAKDGRHSSSFVVGSEGGGVFKCQLRDIARTARVGERPPEAEMAWDASATEALLRVPQGNRYAVAKHVERHARTHTLREVTMSVLYDAKPPSESIFPSPIDLVFEPHVGPVHMLDCSPFHRSLFLSTGADGRVNLYSLLSTRPLQTLEPTASYLFAGAWSRVRPMVFACAGADGSVYVFDLYSSIVAPAATLEGAKGRAGRGGRGGRRDASAAVPPVYSLSFNPRQRTFLAAGDADGHVRVWKLGWKLSNAQSGEEDTLKRFVDQWQDNAVDDVEVGGDTMSAMADFSGAGGERRRSLAGSDDGW